MIRYDSEYNKNIARVVSNFNRKISRLQKLGNEVLPSKVYVSDIKSKFDNRRDLNQYLRDLQRFSKRGAENVVTIGSKQFTKYDIDLFRRRLRSERTRLRKDLADAENYKSKYPMEICFIRRISSHMERTSSNRRLGYILQISTRHSGRNHQYQPLFEQKNN